jgi:redox-sensitive bicupin YhaK (pirin superfamily)
VVVTESRIAAVGGLEVRRALPTRGRRTVGAWCFADHYGPADTAADIGPHPHMGLQTVSWLLTGELLHLDSLGSEQIIKPGQLNLMTAGRGVSHAEEATPQYVGSMHGIQLWVAQPESTRDGAPAFEHHGQLPVADVGTGEATVLVGDFAGVSSPARRDSDHVGVDLALGSGTATVGVDPAYEYGLIVFEGAVTVGGRGATVAGTGATVGGTGATVGGTGATVGGTGAAVGGTAVTPGHLAYLGMGRDELALTGPGRALLMGGVPFPDELVMWWNFVARSKDEIDAAQRDWSRDSGRFGEVASHLKRVEVGPPPWRPSASGDPRSGS